jgi:hypothetical protein
MFAGSVGGELFGGERHEARRSRGRGGALQVNDVRGWQRNFRARLIGFQRTRGPGVPPRAQEFENKLRAVALRKTDRIGGGFGAVAGGKQLAEGPPAAGGEVAQSPFMAAFGGDSAPAVVKHCQFATAPVACSASLF